MSESLATQFATQVLDRFEVGMAFSYMRPQRAEHHVRSSTFFAIVFALRVFALTLRAVSFGFLFGIVALVTLVALERSH